ncbi:type II toxin-antitoxin system RelE/ParE family toxin [bacterium]|nr:type II toxin-antitoxin system RelE/ParE family toxin [bacterium]
MSYTIEISNAAKREFRRLSRDVQGRMRAIIDSLADDPRPSGVRKLTHPPDTYRIRVGQYRIIYQIDDSVELVLIIAAGPRSSVYRHIR